MGCSWTAGAELADPETFSDWPGIVDLTSDYSRRWSRDWFVNRREPQLINMIDRAGPDVIFELEQRERARAWPALLAEIGGHTVINAAKNGAGQEQLLLQIREDLQDSEPCTVIAQLTSPYRWLYPNLYTRTQPWTSVLVSVSYEPGSPEHHAQQAFRAWPKESAEIKWMIDLLNLIDYCSLRGHRLWMIQAWDWEFNPNEYPELWAQIEPYMISSQSIDQQFGHSQRMPGGHPTAATHRELAEWFADRLKDINT